MICKAVKSFTNLLLDFRFNIDFITNKILSPIKIIGRRCSIPLWQSSDAYKISQRVFIQQEVTFKILEIEKVREQLNKMKDELRTVVSFFDWSHIANKFAESNIKTIKRVKDRRTVGTTLTHDPKEVIYNFSSYVLSETEKALLCKGLNFAIPPKKLKFENP